MHRGFGVGLLENIRLADGEKAMKQRDIPRFNDATAASPPRAASLIVHAASEENSWFFLQPNVADSCHLFSEIIFDWAFSCHHGTRGDVPWKENLIRVMLFAMLFSGRECPVNHSIQTDFALLEACKDGENYMVIMKISRGGDP